MEKSSLKVGDLMVNFGEVFKIIKIEKKEINAGKKESVIFYKSYYSENQTHDAVHSLPVKNLSLTSLRKLISKKELEELLGILSKPIDDELPIDVLEFKQSISANNPFEMAYLIRRIWMEQQANNSELSHAKSKLYAESMKILSEEIALVKQTTLSSARQLISKALKK
jgi:RNA polymerase-interacting CarD/CdnL/TRCF family regulator